MGMIEMKFYEDGNKAWQKLKGENMEHKLSFQSFPYLSLS